MSADDQFADYQREKMAARRAVDQNDPRLNMALGPVDPDPIYGIGGACKPPSANTRQVGGSHYKQADGGEEHWDRVARMNLDYFQAQVTRYVERWKLKGGVQDLHKARHFLDKYIELVEAGKVPLATQADSKSL